MCLSLVFLLFPDIQYDSLYLIYNVLLSPHQRSLTPRSLSPSFCVCVWDGMRVCVCVWRCVCMFRSHITSNLPLDYIHISISLFFLFTLFPAPTHTHILTLTHIQPHTHILSLSLWSSITYTSSSAYNTVIYFPLNSIILLYILPIFIISLSSNTNILALFCISFSLHLSISLFLPLCISLLHMI